jgi:hypothetical protein
MSDETADSMVRDTAVTFYVTAETHSALKDEARQADDTLSTYVHGLVQGSRHAETLEEKARELNAEERIEQLLAEGKDELRSIARSVEQRNDDVADMVARAGTYSIVNFELLKRAHSPPETWIDDAFGTGSRRLRKPLAEHADLDAGDPTTESEDSSDGSLVDDLR